MKTTELMIGDWVNVPMAKLTARIDSILSKREAHNDACIVVDFNGQGYLAHYTENDLKPILLTAEILEKNGLKYEVDYGGYHRSILGSHSKDNEPLICVQWNPQGEISQWEVSNKSGILTGVVAYGYTAIAVHELQHILRMVGLNDLADNFKI
jgi:hypothetical protein